MHDSINETKQTPLKREVSNLIKITFYMLSFIILGLLFGFLTFKILSFSRIVEVPDLYGKSPVEASRILRDKGLILKIEGEDYDSTVLPGHIIKQDVPAQKKVKEGRGIKVVLSKGPRVQSIPALVNETLSNAEAILIQKGLKIGRVIRVHSDRIEKDRIIAQTPEPTEKISDYITLLVSAGPHESIYYCPDFKDMSVDEAKDLIERLNLKIETTGSGDRIRSQKPKPRTYIKTGDTVYLQLY
ncbi:MAG: PASTA domain-containing protein [Thermodesulfovibrionales bacterium]